MYGYDDLGRQESVEEYANGNMTTPVRETSYEYDPITQQQTLVDSPEGEVHHEYDAATGRLIRTYTDNNDTSYTYNDLGQLNAVTQTKLNGAAVSLTTSYVYDGAGNQHAVTDPNGVVSTYTYDDLNRLIDQVVTQSDGDKLFEQHFTLLDDGQRDYVIEKRYDGSSSTPFSKIKIDWTYDDDGRLLGETRDADSTPGDGSDDFGTQEAGDYTDTYSFDLNGNRISKSHDEAGTSSDSVVLSEYNERDQLTQSGADDDADGTLDAAEVDSTYTYDANGSTLSETSNSGTKKYVWDLRNRMVGLDANGDGDTTDSGDATMGYDHNGVRVSENVVGGDSTTYLQDTNNPTGYSQVLEEYTNSILERSYAIGQSVLGQSDSNGIRFLLSDGHGSTRLLLDGSGNIVLASQADYDAYGNALGFNPASFGTHILYTNQLFDPIVEQYVLRARYYNQAIGEFSSFDSYEGTMLHKYLYANGDPANLFDPTGHFGLGELLSLSGIDTLLSSLEFTGFSAVHKVVHGVQEGQNANQIFASFLIDQAVQVGALVGLSFLGSVIGGLRDGSLFASLVEEGQAGIVGSASKAEAIEAEVFQEEQIFFGQRRAGPIFGPGNPNPEIAGKTIEEVAAKLRSGQLSASDLPIQVFRDPGSGKLVSINTRSLAALSKAGVQPVYEEITMTTQLLSRTA